jgi:hypothetical protein
MGQESENFGERPKGDVGPNSRPSKKERERGNLKQKGERENA